jgi:hypothetical protein
MTNTLREFPSDQFKIVGFCACGHSAPVDTARLLPDITIEVLRGRLRCQVCGAREVGLRIIWIAAGGFKHSGG